MDENKRSRELRFANMIMEPELAKQIKLQDEIDYNADMGYIPSAEKIRQLKEYEKKTGIIIRNPNKEGVINSVCPEGYVFVSAHRTSDGTFVRSFCRKRGSSLKIPEKYAYRRK